jgi:hypothetical protein
MSDKLIRNRVDEIESWYDVERNRMLDELDAYRHKRLCAIRERCDHKWAAWVQVEQEMAVGWITFWSRSCSVCSVEERSETKPDGAISEHVSIRPSPFI